jgi:hypothetical protein
MLKKIYCLLDGFFRINVFGKKELGFNHEVQF